ncbi:hypothetical protein J2W80_006097 [Methylorubrum extorquens]|nr:hypothetical protein [Methylorubrum extorquens]
MSWSSGRESGSPDPDFRPTVRVVLPAGSTVRLVDVWSGTRTSLHARLVTVRPFASVQHFLNAERTRWKAGFDLPIGEVVTTCRVREPAAGQLFLVTEDGLEPLTYAQAWDRVDPTGAEEGLAEMEHDARAAKAGLPRELTRFVGPHSLQNGVHPIGDSHYYAERCTVRQAFWRRATRAEIEAL